MTILSKKYFVYEVNLTIEKKLFDKNKDWLIDHFHQMVISNNFIKLDLFYQKNVDPINDEHMRYQRIVAQYLVDDYDVLHNYFDKQAKVMRSQVVEKLGYGYSVNRRVFEKIETFENEG